MPEGALELLSDLFSESPEDSVVAVVLVADPLDTDSVWHAGARVLLSRSADMGKLGAALMAASQHLWLIDPALAPSIFATLPRVTSPLQVDLTPRELDVLRLLADGLSNKRIAHKLTISEHTVKFHINAIMGKLGVQSRTEAVVHATRAGLIFL